jgi:hypothetical protein
MASSPNFVGTLRYGRGALSAANTNLDGTGSNIVTVFTAGSNGSRIESITVRNTATVAAGMVRLFINDGTNNDLWREIPIVANAPSGTVASQQYVIDCTDNSPENYLALPSGHSLRAATHNAENFRVLVQGGDL